MMAQYSWPSIDPARGIRETGTPSLYCPLHKKEKVTSSKISRMISFFFWDCLISIPALDVAA